jgi:hypothetical protein
MESLVMAFGVGAALYTIKVILFWLHGLYKNRESIKVVLPHIEHDHGLENAQQQEINAFGVLQDAIATQIIDDREKVKHLREFFSEERLPTSEAIPPKQHTEWEDKLRREAEEYYSTDPWGGGMGVVPTHISDEDYKICRHGNQVCVDQSKLTGVFDSYEKATETIRQNLNLRHSHVE